MTENFLFIRLKQSYKRSLDKLRANCRHREAMYYNRGGGRNRQNDVLICKRCGKILWTPRYVEAISPEKLKFLIEEENEK